MAQMTMYPAKDGSPETTTTALLSDNDTTVAVAELSCFPAVGAEGGNLLTLWNDTTFETCLYTAKSSASGTGTLTIVRSGAQHSSTSGGGIEWPSGTKCARTGTGYDFTAYKNNIEDLDIRLDTAVSDISSIDGRVTTAEGTISTAVSDISSIDGRVTTAEGTLSTAVSDISSIDGRVTTLENTAGIDPVMAALIFG